MAELSTKNEKTKYRLAQAIKECMKTTPVDRITVKEIVETCQVTRQTFYRNFQDKYDLINCRFFLESQHTFFTQKSYFGHNFSLRSLRKGSIKGEEHYDKGVCTAKRKDFETCGNIYGDAVTFAGVFSAVYSKGSGRD
mgnify:CR=1 FL=1